MEEQIREALELLDHADPENWDARTGKPKLSVVRGLVGDQTITREQVDAARPGFVREALEGDGAEEEVVTTEAHRTAPAAPASDRGAAQRHLDAKVSDLEEKRHAALKRMQEAKAEANAIERDIDAERHAFAQRFPPLTKAEKHKQWVERQIEERRKRAENRRAAAAAMRGPAMSPLDQSMAARRGFGLQRPSYPPPRAGGKEAGK